MFITQFSRRRLASMRATPGVVAALLLVGCEEEPQLPGDEVVVATVGEARVSEYDVQRALDKSLGKFAVKNVERQARAEVVESLIQSKAMAQLADKALSPKEKLVLEKEVESYRESLLVKQYLAKENPPQPVTLEDVKKYYDAHPALYGGLSDKKYELIFGKQPAAGNTRIALLKNLTALSRESDWKQGVEAQEDAPELGFSSGVVSEKALHPKLKEVLKGLKNDTPSNVVFVQGRAYVGRIVGETKGRKTPFADVSAEIKKSLAIVRARDAIREVGKAAAGKMKVTRPKSKKKESSDE